MQSISISSRLNRVPQNNMFAQQGVQKNTPLKTISNYSTAPVRHSNAYMPYLSNISFGRSIEEHNSWGATVKPDGDVKFKIWATKGNIDGITKKVKDVYVEIAPYSTTKDMRFEDGFIDVDEGGNVTSDDKFSKVIKLENTSNGIYEGLSHSAMAGDNYRYVIVYEDGSAEGVKDPNAKRQDGVYNWSTIYDHKDFKWTDQSWMKAGNSKKIARKEDGLIPTISEVHVGVIDQKGNFDSVKQKIDEYARKKTFNTIELMPLEGCYFNPETGIGYNWGYDGVDKTTPNPYYGGPDKLKELVNYAHEKGINMIVDMVPNHMGPYGNCMQKIADYADPNGSPWGMAFNYERQDNRYVRDYMVNASLNWLKNYHFDGIRFDATSQMNSAFTMKQIAKECQFHAPNSYLICEDYGSNPGDGNKLCNSAVIMKSNEKQDEMEKATQEEKEKIHEELIEDISHNRADLGKLNFDSQWDFPFHHSLESLLLDQNYFGYQPTLDDFVFTLRNGPFNTKYFMSHDEIGNNSGTRLITKLLAAKLNLAKRIPPYNESQNWGPVAESSQEFMQERKHPDAPIWNADYQKEKYGIEAQVKYEDFQKAFNQARALNKMALVSIFVAPGPKMIFDGDEKGSINRFKFFAEHEDPKSHYSCSKEKGYDTSLPAFFDSKQHKSPDFYDSEVEKLSDKLFALYNSSKALQSQKNDNNHFGSYVYSQPKVVQILRKEGNEEILSVMNFGNSNFSDFVLNDVSNGKWTEVVSTKEDKSDNGTVKASDSHLKISLPKQSVVIFKKEN